jgi:hypothetical protein
VEELPTNHRLLPPERWVATWILARQRADPTPYVLRLQQNYGPEGNVLVLVGLTGVFLGNMLGLVGVVLFVASNEGGVVGLIGKLMLLAGSLLGLWCGVIRGIQGSREGRRFRGGRPFVWRS